MSKNNFEWGGPRQRVYDYMRSLGFVMSDWSDKVWKRADGKQVHIFGAGSMAKLGPNEFPLGELSKHL